MTRLSLPLLAAVLVTAGGLTGLTGCAEAQRMVTDAGRIADGAGGMITTSAASWNTDASEFRGRTGTFALDCPPTDRATGSVWGSNPYTDDSKVCKAGVHAGVITTRGGRVLIQSRPGQNRYVGSTRNGVLSSDYGSWGGSFAIVSN